MSQFISLLRSKLSTSLVRRWLPSFIPGLLGLVLLLAPLTNVVAADEEYWAVDPDFKAGSGPDSTVQTIAIQSDGRILIGGLFTAFTNTATPYLARLNPDGSLDTSFNVGGAGFNAPVNSIAVQSDGKILVGGFFTTYNGLSSNYLARLNPNGSLDTSFNAGGVGFNSLVRAIVVQGDGKILVGGSFSAYNTLTYNRLIRLNANGSPDLTFSSGVGANDYYLRSIVVQSDGKILIGGSFLSYSGTATPKIARLHPNGTLDTTFAPDSSFSPDEIFTIALQSNGKILVGGAGLFGTGRGLARLNPNGSFDTSFNGGQAGANAAIEIIKVQNDDKILVGGWFNAYNQTSRGRLARLNIDGSLDSTFLANNPGANVNGFAVPVATIAIQNNNEVIIGGAFTTYNNTGRMRLARLHANGNLDLSFLGNDMAANDGIRTIKVLADGKILVGGWFTAYADVIRPGLARLNADGSIDHSFTPAISFPGNSPNIQFIIVQNDGKILVGGYFTSANWAVPNGIVRLNADGSLDSSFNFGITEVNRYIHHVVVQNDGKILVAGYFSNDTSTIRMDLVRLNTDGSLDSSFTFGVMGASQINSLVIQNDGKILVAGNYEVTCYYYLVKLNPDGSINSTLYTADLPRCAGAITDLTLQPDGKVLVTGYFPDYNNTGRAYLVRLNADGSLDSSFNYSLQTCSESSGYVRSAALQSDGKILIICLYDDRAARLNPDGSIETPNFPVIDLPIQYYSSSLSLIEQSPGKLLAVGSFNKLGDFTRTYLGRLETKPKTASTTSLSSSSSSISFGQVVTFTATVTPASATGSVEFVLGSGATTNKVSRPLVNGVATYSTNGLAVGTIPVRATYTGVLTVTSSSSPTLTQTVNKAATQLVLGSSATTTSYGQSVSFRAVVSTNVSNPLVAISGPVNFSVQGSSSTVTATVELSGGVASYALADLPADNYVVTASYGGNANHSSATGSVNLVVEKAVSRVKLNSSANPVLVGRTLTFTTHLSPLPANINGTVSFNFSYADGSSSSAAVAVVNGVASYVTTTQSTGSFTVTTSYTGDANRQPGSSPNYVQQVITGCDPLLVTQATDDGQATACGTLSYALDRTIDGTISFNLPQNSNILSFSSGLTRSLKPDVALDGGVSGIILDGSWQAGDGLRLSGGNSLVNLTLRGFAGRELVLNGTANRFYQVRIHN